MLSVNVGNAMERTTDQVLSNCVFQTVGKDIATFGEASDRVIYIFIFIVRRYREEGCSGGFRLGSESSFVGVGVEDTLVDGGEGFLEVCSVDDFGGFFYQVLHIFSGPIDVFPRPVLEKVVCHSADCLRSGGDMSWERVMGFVIERELRFDFGAADAGSGFIHCLVRW